MPRHSFNHSEEILQWVWQELLFSTQKLQTTCGKTIQIIDQGQLNSSDGPDFKRAEININGLRFFGDVEIHLDPKDWYAHKHHLDKNYNSVFLHVIAHKNYNKVECENGDEPLTLNLLPYLDEQLESFISELNYSSLPCASNVHYLSQEIFEQQIKNSHQEYFEKKANDFIKFYNPQISQSKAWKQALYISVFDGFGIAHNRVQMQELVKRLLPISGLNEVEILEKAFKIAGFSGYESNIEWNHKAIRPYSHPKKRVEEAVKLIHAIEKTPFEDFLSLNSINFWKNYCKKLFHSQTNHHKIIFATVYLPAIYTLAKLYAFHALGNSVLKIWRELESPIPKSLLKPFKALPYPGTFYSQKLGSVHQLKHYCDKKRCTQCLVLKSAIQS